MKTTKTDNKSCDRETEVEQLLTRLFKILAGGWQQYFETMLWRARKKLVVLKKKKKFGSACASAEGSLSGGGRGSVTVKECMELVSSVHNIG
jgi:hypothetical protein